MNINENLRRNRNSNIDGLISMYVHTTHKAFSMYLYQIIYVMSYSATDSQSIYIQYLRYCFKILFYMMMARWLLADHTIHYISNSKKRQHIVI